MANRKPGRRSVKKSTKRNKKTLGLESLEDRQLLAADLLSSVADLMGDTGMAHPPGCACAGCCGPAAELGTDLGGGHFMGDGHHHHGDTWPLSAWKGDLHDPTAQPRGHDDDPLTIVLDFNDPGQANTTDGFGNVVGTFDVTAYGFSAAAFGTVTTAIWQQVVGHYDDIVTFDNDQRSPIPFGYDLDIEFEIGNIGTPPSNGSNDYYYIQIGDLVQCGGNSCQLGVTGLEYARKANGDPGVVAVGSVIGSVYTDNIQNLPNLTPSNALSSGNLAFTVDAIAGTASHEIGHGVSLNHINKVGIVTPNSLPPLMGTGAIDLPAQDRIGDREFSFSGTNSQINNRTQRHIDQLVGAIGIRDTFDTNDEIAEAAPISTSQTVTNFEIDRPTDVDLFRFDVTAGQAVGFDIDRDDTTLDARIRLFDATGAELATDDDGIGPGVEPSSLDSYLEYRFDTAGTYYLGVSDFRNDAYDINTGNDDTNASTSFGNFTLTTTNLGTDSNGTIANAQPLAAGVTLTGSISPSIDIDMVSFAAGAEHEVSFDLSNVSGSISPEMRLFDSTGMELSSGDSSFSYTFSTPGIYYIGVADSGLPGSYDPVTGVAQNNNVTQTGSYHFSLQYQSNPLLVTTVDEPASPDGETSLREAVAFANINPGDDVITFDSSLATDSIEVSGSDLNVTDSVTIRGLGVDQLAIVGNAYSRLFNVQLGAGEHFNVEDVTIADAGGAIFSENDANIGIYRSRLTGNTVDDTGGAIRSNGVVEVVESEITGNVAGRGGGISVANGELRMYDSTVSNNMAEYGGGMDLFDSPGTIDGSTISGNSATFVGGIRGNAHNRTLTITGSTIVNNTGGGIETDANDPTTITNTLIAGNTGFARDLRGPVTANFSLFGDTTGATITGASNVENVDPNLVFGPLADNGGPTMTHVLLEGSPAINAADPALSGGSDQNGNPRVIGGVADIGAVEANPAVVRTLGSLTPGMSSQPAYALRPDEAFFYRFELDADVLAASGDSLTIDTLGTQLSPVNNSIIGLYASNGNLIEVNDDGGFPAPDNRLSKLTFGDGGTNDLAAGTYYLAVTHFNIANFGATDFDVSANFSETGDVIVNFGLNVEAPSLLITTASDTVDNTDGETSLREAVAFANLNPGADTITFDSSLSGQTINVTDGQLVVSESLTIDGLGQSNLVVSGDHTSRLFEVLGTTSQFNVEDITLRDGGTSALVGGAIQAGSSTTSVSVTRSRLTSNDSSTGGAINSTGTVSIVDSVIDNNDAVSRGGGINVSGGTLDITSSTFSGNHAGLGGGGIHAINTATTILSSTVAFNDSPNGGGVEFFGTTGTVRNSIFSDNTASNNGPDILGDVDANFSLVADTMETRFTGTSANNITGQSAMLGALADDGSGTMTHALLEGSPAINAADPALSGGSDQNGDPRVIGGVADMGAVEANPAVVRTLGALPEGATSQGAYDLRAREVIFYRFELDADVLAANGDTLVIDTLGSTLNADNDSEMGLYDASGNRVADNDDIGAPNLLSQLSFGDGGINGDLNAGTYYVSLSAFDTTFGESNFDVTSTSGSTGDIVANFNLNRGGNSLACDFDGNTVCDGADIDALQANIVSGPADPGTFDLTNDNLVTVADRDVWLVLAGAENLASGNAYLPGDANLDGVVDASDFNAWNGSKFTSTSNWTDGDFNSDGVVDASDFNVWNANKFTSSDSLSRSTDDADEDRKERRESGLVSVLDRVFAELG